MSQRGLPPPGEEGDAASATMRQVRAATAIAIPAGRSQTPGDNAAAPTLSCQNLPIPMGATLLSCGRLMPGSDAFSAEVSARGQAEALRRYYQSTFKGLGLRSVPVADTGLPVPAGTTMDAFECASLSVAVSVTPLEGGRVTLAIAWQNGTGGLGTLDPRTAEALRSLYRVAAEQKAREGAAPHGVPTPSE